MATTAYVEIDKARVEEVYLETKDDAIDVNLPNGYSITVYGDGTVEAISAHFPFTARSSKLVKKLKKDEKAGRVAHV